MARAVYENRTNTPVELWIEPWADVETVGSGDRVYFELEGENASFELSVGERHTVAWAWADKVSLSVWSGDEEVADKGRAWAVAPG